MRRPPSWPARPRFPVPTAWEPFEPLVEVAVTATRAVSVSERLVAGLRARTVEEAAGRLLRSEIPVRYRVLPFLPGCAARSALAPGCFLPFELDVAILSRRGDDRPRHVPTPLDARLFDDVHGCGAFFEMYRTTAGVLRVCVGGRDADECRTTAHGLVAWLRALRRDQHRREDGAR